MHFFCKKSPKEELRCPGAAQRCLQVRNAVANFFGATLVPELGANVAAGTTSNVKIFLVAVAAMRALPHQFAIIFHDLDLAVEATFLAVVALGVQFRVHDVVVNVLNHTNNGLQVVLHIRRSSKMLQNLPMSR